MTKTAVSTKLCLKKPCLARSPIWRLCALRVHNVVSYPGFSSASLFWGFHWETICNSGGVEEDARWGSRLYKDSCEDGCSCVAQRATWGEKTPFPSRRCVYFSFELGKLGSPQVPSPKNDDLERETWKYGWMMWWYSNRRSFQITFRQLLETKLRHIQPSNVET